MLFLSSYQHSGDLHRAGVKVLREGKQKQATNADAPGFHEVAARKKKNLMRYLSAPQEFNPKMFSAYINIHPYLHPHFKSFRCFTGRPETNLCPHLQGK